MLDPEKPLTARQTAVRNFIATFHAGRGRLPTRREIAAGLGWPAGGYICRVVGKLRARGEITRIERAR